MDKDCTTTLLTQDGDRKDMSISDASPMMGHMSHTLTASTSKTDFTFKVILKELVSLATGNYKAFLPPKNHKIFQKALSNVQWVSQQIGHPHVLHFVACSSFD